MNWLTFEKKKIKIKQHFMSYAPFQFLTLRPVAKSLVSKISQKLFEQVTSNLHAALSIMTSR